MNEKPLGTNGRNGVSVSDQTLKNNNPLPDDDFSGLKYVDVEPATPANEESSTPPRSKPRRLVRGLLLLGTLALAVVGFFFWVSGSGKKSINVPVRDRSAQSEQADQPKSDDVTAQAIAEVRGASASPDPSLATTPSASAATANDTDPVTVPLGGTVTTVDGATASTATGGSSTNGAAEGAAETIPKPNTERSIRCAPIQKDVTAPPKPLAAPQLARGPVGAVPARPAAAEKPVTLPSFGSLLPVRTLGAIYTLRPSLSRFELTRDVRGQGWMMKKGTILVGQQMGNELDRAYVGLTGFIDPASGKLVRLAGDALGADGAPGLRGKRRQINSRWARILSRAVEAGVTLGQAALSRGGTTVNIQGSVSPELQGLNLNAVQRREFVEVPAGATAFILVTDLPKETRGVDPQAVPDGGGNSSQTSQTSQASQTLLEDGELANLITSGSPEQIKAALPRMTPELRRIAELVLREAGNSDVAEGSTERKR